MQLACVHHSAGSDKQALVDTVHSVLTTTAAAGLESVALPLIGSGNAGWAVQLAAEAHIEALLQFVNAKNTASSLKVPVAVGLLTTDIKPCLKSDTRW